MSTDNPRYEAIRTAAARRPRSFERPTGTDGRVLGVAELFGRNTFGVHEIRGVLDEDVVQRFIDTVEHGKPLDRDVAEAIAGAVLRWATQRGVTHFCHWFQPMTGATAEKHDSFLTFRGDRPILALTGDQLLQSEPDASSFPSGGMRTTFEARGYTAWDPTSPMFIMERTNGATLCIPSVFVSYHGDALDKKTPLLRSMDAIGEQALRLCRLLGDDDVTRVIPTAGPEQEYFLVDKAYASLRPDLLIAGRTLIGHRPPKGQTMEDHYFGSIPARVQAFMHELETELYKVGVPAKTRHNEVAPSQFEIAVIYSEANVAADHNQILMELLRKVAERHDFHAVLHEKPFEGVNGSGKHLNWSLAAVTPAGRRNLFEPGATPGQNVRFLAFLSAVLLGVYRYGALLRASVASHGNDFRLGANEAPPAIISVFLGHVLSRICDAIASGKDLPNSPEEAMIEVGVHRLPRVARDNTDRNRTSPFAFTGDKFEFRAVGANMSISFPLTCLHAAVSDGIRQVCDWADEAGGGEAGVYQAIRRALIDSAPIRFDGNNYDPAWVEEAERRGLPNLRATPEALEVLRQPEVIDLMKRSGIYRPEELASNYRVRVERYVTTADIECDVMRDLVDQVVLPAALAERAAIGSDLVTTHTIQELLTEEDTAHFDWLNQHIAELRAARAELDAALAGASGLEGAGRARWYAGNVVSALATLRRACDAIEARITDSRWPLPRYREMLFQR